MRAIFYLATAVVWLPACKNAVPSLGSLTEISGFSIDQTSVTASQKTNPSFTVSGKCPKSLSQIEISFDGGLRWVDSAVVATTNFNCSDKGSFSLFFDKDVTSYLDEVKIKSAGGLIFRGQTEFGTTSSILLAILQPSLGNYPTGIAASSHFEKVGNYFVRTTVRPSSINSDPVVATNNPKYIVKLLKVGIAK